MEAGGERGAGLRWAEEGLQRPGRLSGGVVARGVPASSSALCGREGCSGNSRAAGQTVQPARRVGEASAGNRGGLKQAVKLNSF